MTASSLEGPVSRHLNRRLSRPLARLLAPTPVSPNQVSLFSFLVALGAFAAFGLEQAIVAGVLIQASSVIDGVDGDLARLQGRASRFGAVFDAFLDRAADAVIVAGMAWWAFDHPGSSGPEPFVVGLAAMTGFLMISYSRARMEGEGYRELLAGRSAGGGLASRDVRLLIAAVGSAAGQPYYTLVVLGSMSYLALIWRLWLVYRSDGARRSEALGA